jgi:hypothetical protein
MTREETKKCVEVMQAYVDGKEVERHLPEPQEGGWHSMEDPGWEFPRCKYRIKEEPIDPRIVEPGTSWRYGAFAPSIEEQKRHIKYVDSKPFDWIGKNIQWVRCLENKYYCVSRVLNMNDRGITIYGSISDGFNLWKDLTNSWEWSEDNKTWRKFE